MRIEVFVKPKSGKQKVEKITEFKYRAYLKKEAEDNKANVELLKLLKKYFGREVRILKGARVRSKIIEVR